MANILGCNFGHDGSIALLKDNKIVCAVGNERVSRIKKARGVSAEMVDYVLREGGLTLDQIDYVAFSSYFYREENSYFQFLDLQGNPIQRDLIHLVGGLPFAEYRVRIGQTVIPALLIQHHIAHCASSFYTSPFERAACFSVDASGVHPEYCSLYCYGEGNQLHYLYCPGLMLGNAYSVFTAKLGLGPGLTKAGTTMALACYGEKLPCVTKWREYGMPWYERKFQPSDAVYVNKIWSEFSGLPPMSVFSKEQSDSKHCMDIAASLQYVFEEVLVDYTNRLYNVTKEYSGGNLCLSGGSCLNSDANMQIRLRTPFERIHLFPGCGDDGTAVGAALYTYHHLLNEPRVNYAPREFMYLGREYSVQNVQGRPYSATETAQAISDGKIVAWFQGRSEFGPRALGNRSILADPRNPEMKDRLNARVKHREWFRPFAPSVLSHRATEWFELDFETKLMLFIAKVKRPTEVPAIVHVDNTARLQTVEREDNSRYYELIEEFDKITGVPLILNTSLNVNNEPLVESPDDALRFFEKTEVEMLVLGDQVFDK